ncbi:uncharacterized protein LOC141745975 [Larus michahellis]|uniref:uncharacterized protein LOC141745975 n=1 Tax=Larus michahellis TaxID=119627 RepID=UPI003D9B6F86
MWAISQLGYIDGAPLAVAMLLLCPSGRSSLLELGDSGAVTGAPCSWPQQSLNSVPLPKGTHAALCGDLPEARYLTALLHDGARDPPALCSLQRIWELGCKPSRSAKGPLKRTDRPTCCPGGTSRGGKLAGGDQRKISEERAASPRPSTADPRENIRRVKKKQNKTKHSVQASTRRAKDQKDAEREKGERGRDRLTGAAAATTTTKITLKIIITIIIIKPKPPTREILFKKSERGSEPKSWSDRVDPCSFSWDRRDRADSPLRSAAAQRAVPLPAAGGGRAGRRRSIILAGLRTLRGAAFENKSISLIISGAVGGEDSQLWSCQPRTPSPPPPAPSPAMLRVNFDGTLRSGGR